MARIHKGGLPTNLGLCASYDIAFQTKVCTKLGLKRVKTHHMMHINLGLSTNLLCEFGPLRFGLKRAKVSKMKRLSPYQ